MIPIPQPITIVRYSLGAADEFGSPVETWAADATPTLVHAVAPVEGGWTVYAPAGTVVTVRDRVVWQGVTYFVAAHPDDFTAGPWNNPAAGVVFGLRRSEGVVTDPNVSPYP